MFHAVEDETLKNKYLVPESLEMTVIGKVETTAAIKIE